MVGALAASDIEPKNRVSIPASSSMHAHGFRSRFATGRVQPGWFTADPHCGFVSKCRHKSAFPSNMRRTRLIHSSFDTPAKKQPWSERYPAHQRGYLFIQTIWSTCLQSKTCLPLLPLACWPSSSINSTVMYRPNHHYKPTIFPPKGTAQSKQPPLMKWISQKGLWMVGILFFVVAVFWVLNRSWLAIPAASIGIALYILEPSIDWFEKEACPWRRAVGAAFYWSLRPRVHCHSLLFRPSSFSSNRCHKP